VAQLEPEDVNYTRHIVGWAAEVRKNIGMDLFNSILEFGIGTNLAAHDRDSWCKI
jgi:hypothetical protein